MTASARATGMALPITSRLRLPHVALRALPALATVLELPVLATAVVLATAAAPALAVDDDLPVGQPLWELGAGVGGLRLPHYRGSDQSHNWVLPVPYVVYRGRILRADRDGARAVLLDSERLDVDVSLAATAPTRSSDNRARAGMSNLAGTLELGPNLNVTLAKGTGWKFDLRVPVRAVFTLQRSPEAIGFTIGPVLNLDLDAAGWRLGFQGGPVAATRRNNAYFYDVALADATASRPAYRSDGGFGGWRLTAAASRRLGNWWLAGFVRGDTVDGARFDSSPLVRQRSNLSVGFAASWVFKVSDERVAPRR